jgi:hypothetical protein
MREKSQRFGLGVAEQCGMSEPSRNDGRLGRVCGSEQMF